MTYDPIISFRMSTAEYERLVKYAQDNHINVSEAIRRAIKWMMILKSDRRER